MGVSVIWTLFVLLERLGDLGTARQEGAARFWGV